MARDFDGTNDRIAFGSDASVDNFTALSIAMWGRVDTAASAFDVLFRKSSANTNGWQLGYLTFGAARIYFQAGYSGTGADLASWSMSALAAGQVRHIAIVLDPSSASNNPVIYVNGASQTVTTETAPSGAYGADAAATLQAGEDAGGGSDFDGAQQNVAYANALWDAAAVNRAMWWGRPHGGIEVYHPFYTDKLANEGTATADGTATGTVVLPMACPVQRPGSAMMGMGAGW